MANYQNLKAAISAAIKTNGNQEITGQVLQNVLNSIVSVIGDNYTFAGVATPATNPGTPDQNVVYIALQAGTYVNFKGKVLPNGISLLMWVGSWTSEILLSIDEEVRPESDNLVQSGAVVKFGQQYGDIVFYNGSAGNPESTTAICSEIFLVDYNDTFYIETDRPLEDGQSYLAEFHFINDVDKIHQRLHVGQVDRFLQLNRTLNKPIQFDEYTYSITKNKAVMIAIFVKYNDISQPLSLDSFDGYTLCVKRERREKEMSNYFVNNLLSIYHKKTSNINLKEDSEYGSIQGDGSVAYFNTDLVTDFISVEGAKNVTINLPTFSIGDGNTYTFVARVVGMEDKNNTNPRVYSMGTDKVGDATPVTINLQPNHKYIRVSYYARLLNSSINANIPFIKDVLPFDVVSEIQFNPDAFDIQKESECNEKFKRIEEVSYDILFSQNFDKAEDFNLLFKDTIGKTEAFIFFSDPHWCQKYNDVSMGFMYDIYLNRIRRHFTHTPTDFVLCGGDWLTSHKQSTAIKCLATIDGVMNKTFPNSYYPIFGNHDNNYQGELDGTSDTSVNDGTISNQTMINIMFRRFGKMYYTFKGSTTKFYILDSGRDWGAEYMNDYSWEQVDWFANSLIDNVDEHIVIGIHIVDAFANELSTFGETIAAFANNVSLVAKAFNERGSITLNGKTYDFSNSEGTIHCMLCGHTHFDATYVLNTIPVFCIDDSMTGNFDLVLIDYGAHKLKSVRVGSGDNRELNLYS